MKIVKCVFRVLSLHMLSHKNRISPPCQRLCLSPESQELTHVAGKRPGHRAAGSVSRCLASLRRERDQGLEARGLCFRNTSTTYKWRNGVIKKYYKRSVGGKRMNKRTMHMKQKFIFINLGWLTYLL